MGHSNVDITLNTYTSTIDSVDKKIAEQFNETFNNLKSLSWKCPIAYFSLYIAYSKLLSFNAFTCLA